MTAAHADQLSTEAVDRIVIAVAHHAEQARRAATLRDRVAFRRWVLRGDRRVRFLRMWGLS